MTTLMRPRIGAVGLAALAITATALAGPARASDDTATAAGGHTATQAAIEAAVAAGIPGVTAEARDADGIWKSAVGVGDRQTGAARAKNDRFRIGSLTDSFVATVLLQMEAEKKIDLDASVEHYLPGVVTGNGNDGSTITVRQLLNHTSGLFDYLADVPYYETYTTGDSFFQHRYDTLTPQQRLKVAFAQPPLFQPGARHSFSHTNDILAALIVEKVGGTSYESQVRKRIIEPLALKATSNPGTGATVPRPSSRGYSKLYYATQPDRIDDVTEFNASQLWGDGDMISSAADLNRFYKALMGGKLLPAKQLTELKTTVVNPDLPISSYGLGIEKLALPCGTTIWYHDGGSLGSLTLAAFSENGRHELTFNYNGDWDASGLLPILSAEFCEPTS
ncbi:serine hydrolase domain-containing protein [Streptomyces sp. NPDC001260]|uniref:serine hydrolase domain-containing protein n=1 Tax=Streptomyces sp. NPDC001260 TaxID=3364551 RepID=UPI00367B9241